MLRIREGYLNYAPKIVKCIPTTKYNIEMAKNAADILEENRIEGENIEVDIGRYSDWKRRFHSILILQPLGLDSYPQQT